MKDLVPKGVWALAALLVVTGCRKPEEELGLDLLPGDRLEVSVDTARIHAFTIADSSIRTNGLSRQLLGTYLDPQFGVVNAGIITQILLPGGTNIGIDTDTSGLVADSLVLAFAFDGFNNAYGNLDPQVFEAFELSESITVDSSYRSDRIPSFVNDDLVATRGGSITPKPTTRPVIGGDSLAPQIRIRLSMALAERFVNAIGTSNMADNDQFLEFFKGFYVRANPTGLLPNQGGILYFDLIASASKATLYYRDTNADPVVSRTLDLPINSNSARYTVVEHQFDRAIDGGLQLALADTINMQPTTYIQALAGMRTAIRFPDIMAFGGEGRILAKAELVLPVHGTYYPYYVPPTQLFLFRKDANGADAFLPDQLNGIGAIDGFYRPEERAYRFNITRYIQQLLNGTLENTGVEVIPGSGGVSANRVILSGPGATETPMRLKLTFTDY
ncbi:MAG: DUF4270 family protein [Flavobacteriales bacterium]|nr:DUF4270 family protein [Flavobacteriales bacterium]